MQDRTRRNDNILNKLGPGGDAGLDQGAYAKSVDEAKKGVMAGPFASMELTGFKDVCLIPRQAVWEQHGDADEPSVRVIGNMLWNQANETLGTASAD